MTCSRFQPRLKLILSVLKTLQENTLSPAIARYHSLSPTITRYHPLSPITRYHPRWLLSPAITLNSLSPRWLLSPAITLNSLSPRWLLSPAISYHPLSPAITRYHLKSWKYIFRGLFIEFQGILIWRQSKFCFEKMFIPHKKKLLLLLCWMREEKEYELFELLMKFYTSYEHLPLVLCENELFLLLSRGSFGHIIYITWRKLHCPEEPFMYNC